jgi:hypothetical protein
MSNLLLDLCKKWEPFKSDDFAERAMKSAERRQTSISPAEMPYTTGGAGLSGFKSWLPGDWDDDGGDDFDDITGC